MGVNEFIWDGIYEAMMNQKMEIDDLSISLLDIIYFEIIDFCMGI